MIKWRLLFVGVAACFPLFEAPDTTAMTWSSEVREIDREELERRTTEQNASGPSKYIEHVTGNRKSTRVRTHLSMMDVSLGLSNMERSEAISAVERKYGYSQEDANQIVQFIRSNALRRPGRELLGDVCQRFPSEWRVMPNLDTFAQYLRDLQQQETQRQAEETDSFLAALSERARRRLLDNSEGMLKGQAVTVRINYQTLLRESPTQFMAQLESVCSEIEEKRR